MEEQAMNDTLTSEDLVQLRAIKTSEEEEGEITNQSGLRPQDQSLMTRLRCE